MIDHVVIAMAAAVVTGEVSVVAAEVVLRVRVAEDLLLVVIAERARVVVVKADLHAADSAMTGVTAAALAGTEIRDRALKRPR